MEYLKEAKYAARKQACVERSRKANRWARRMLWIAAGLGFFAVYQNRELAPPVHDGMFTGAAVSQDIWGGAHETRGAVQGLFAGGSDAGAAPKYNALTQWLLDNR